MFPGKWVPSGSQGPPARAPLARSPKYCRTNICSLLFCYFVHFLRTNNKITLNKMFRVHCLVTNARISSFVICYFVRNDWTNNKTIAIFLLFVICSIGSNKSAQLNLFQQICSNKFAQLNLFERICAPPRAGLRRSPSFWFQGYHPYERNFTKGSP